MSNPFNPRIAAALVLLGSALFLALLVLVGEGLTQGSSNNGGSHADGHGLNGYAAFAGLLAQEGYAVQRARSPGALAAPGLLVLTPPFSVDGKELERIVRQRRASGPTLVILPKWSGFQLDDATRKATASPKGWVGLDQARAPEIPGFYDDIAVNLSAMPGGGWAGDGLRGTLPMPQAVLSGAGNALVPLASGRDGRILAAYIADRGSYPALAAMAGNGGDPAGEALGAYPVIFVFEPDLLDNYGMAHQESALFADRLVRAALAREPRAITFDLTLNGFQRSPNLLTLAFTPPYLAASLCLIVAAALAMARAFARIPPITPPGPSFGKAALVANSAGLILRARRYRLLAEAYAERGPGTEPAAALRGARKPAQLLDAAQRLHAIERTLNP